MITKEQLQAMSKFELGKTLAKLAGLAVSNNQYMEYADRDENVVLLIPAGDSFSVDNPNDIMPLAFEYGISIIKDHDAEQYYACVAFDDRDYDFAYRLHECYNDSPLRAIACCLILVLQEQKA